MALYHIITLTVTDAGDWRDGTLTGDSLRKCIETPFALAYRISFPALLRAKCEGGGIYRGNMSAFERALTGM